MREEYGIASFRSRQQVLKTEDALRRQGLNVRAVTTPREVAMGCGLSVRFRAEDGEQVRRALRQLNPSNMIGLYRVEQNGNQRPRVRPFN